MRLISIFLLTTAIAACNSSGKKHSKEPMDDTARMDNPSVQKIEPVKGTQADVPSSVKIKGVIREVWTWKDNSGDNILITSIVEPYNDKEKNEYGEEGQSSELHAALYTNKEGSYTQAWSVDGKEKACPFDITCDFAKDGITITDLDADGIAEVTFIYRLACRSDVSPAEMKLVMYEGQNKYMLKGLTWYGSPEDKFDVTEANANLETLPGYKKTEEEYMKTWGRYETEKEFAGAPPEFLTYARNRWMRFVKEGGE